MNWRGWPPRLPEQPIFCPVLDEDCAIKIARDWNVKHSGGGFVTRFEVESEFVSRYPVQQAGGGRSSSCGYRLRSWTASTLTFSARSRWSTSAVESGRRADGQFAGVGCERPVRPSGARSRRCCSSPRGPSDGGECGRGEESAEGAGRAVPPYCLLPVDAHRAGEAARPGHAVGPVGRAGTAGRRPTAGGSGWWIADGHLLPHGGTVFVTVRHWWR